MNTFDTHRYDSRESRKGLLHNLAKITLHKPTRALIWTLVKTELVAQYKRSFIGFSWIFVQPIIAIVSWIILDKANVLSPGEMDVPYPVYVLLMASIWGLFYSTFTATSKIFETNSDLIMQSAVTTEVLVGQKVLLSIIQFSIPLFFNLIILISLGIAIHWTWLLIPLFTLPIISLASALGMLVNSMRILLFDIAKSIDLVFQMLIYITPVIFVESTTSGLMHDIVMGNPLTYLFCALRDIILTGSLFRPLIYLGVVAACFLALGLSYRIHVHLEKMVLERILK